jgi:hypothetical protein
VIETKEFTPLIRDCRESMIKEKIAPMVANNN